MILRLSSALGPGKSGGYDRPGGPAYHGLNIGVS
jgi:hypothetical protein